MIGNADNPMRQLTLNIDEALEPLSKHIPDDEVLSEIVRLFLILSWFEYALKEAGYSKGNNHAEPDCDAFSIQINDELSSANRSEDLIEAIDYLQKYPPRIQTVKIEKDGIKSLGVKFSKLKGKEATNLTQYIKRVRNNQFHGEKIPFKPARDMKLLKSSSTILTHFLKLDTAASVKEHYEQGGHFWSTNHLKS